MKYKCEFPNCRYICEDRSSIHSHHILPVELGGSNKLSNRIYLCPNCHNKIFIPSSIRGIHSIKKKDSIVLIGWLSSTGGKVLQYINSSGDEEFNFCNEG